MADAGTSTRGLRKERSGVVVSKSGDKTIVVSVDRRKQHPTYGKVVRVSKRFHVHDEENAASVGDFVKITECRPMSRTKRWRLVGVVQK